MWEYIKFFHNRNMIYISLLSFTSICLLFSSIYFCHTPNLYSLTLSVVIYMVATVFCLITYKILNSQILKDSLIYIMLPLLISFSMGIEFSYFIYILWLLSFFMIQLICVYEINDIRKEFKQKEIFPCLLLGGCLGLMISISLIYFSLPPLILIIITLLSYYFSVDWYYFRKIDKTIITKDYIKLFFYLAILLLLKVLGYLNIGEQYHLIFHIIYIIYAVWLILLFKNDLFKCGIIIGILILNGLMLPHPHESTNFSIDIALVAAIILLLFIKPPVIYSIKTRYAEFKIVDNKRNNSRLLFSNYVLQGLQYLDVDKRFEPTSYFCSEGPIGQIFHALQSKITNVALIGLGTGTLAAYGKEGQNFTFFEIDPAVKDIAYNYFTYLKDSAAKMKIILGDVRKTLVDTSDHGYDIIICDGYVGGDIPHNLFTYEAIRLYMSKLAQEGILCIHISGKQHIIVRIIGKILKEAGLFALLQSYHLNKLSATNINSHKVGLIGMQRKVEKYSLFQKLIKNLYNFVEKITDNMSMVNEKASSAESSVWICAAREEKYLHEFATNPKWKPLIADDSAELFTDEVIEYNPFSS